MNRTQFLKSLGLTGAALLAVLTACQPEDGVLPDGPVDFNLDLADPANAALQQPGGYVVANGVVVARTTQQQLVAVTQTCSHEGRPQVTFRNNEFYCTAHGARYTTAGVGLNNEGRRGLTVYQIEQTGTSVRIYS